jgi:hypothetical protein
MGNHLQAGFVIGNQTAGFQQCKVSTKAELLNRFYGDNNLLIRNTNLIHLLPAGRIDNNEDEF